MKNLLYTMLLLIGIMGTLSMWVVNADTNCWSWKWTVPTTTYASGIVYGCDENNIPIITIYGNDGKWITIKAMNEWATEIFNQNFSTDPSIINTASFWYHYQWWNNTGFQPCIALWSTSCSSFPWWNAWWGSVSMNKNNWWWSWDTITSNWSWTNQERQWPCPNDYHVPSILEWININTTRWSSVVETWDGFKFASDLLLPPAGGRINGTNIYAQGANGYYRSSSPSQSYYKNVYWLNFGSSFINYSEGQYSFATSIRCFKNPLEFFSLTFRDKNNLDDIIWDPIVNIVEWTQITWWMLPIVPDGYYYIYYSWSDLIDDILSKIINSDAEILVDKITIDYSISYELDGWTNSKNNITWYTIETPTFTLENPTKDWYSFDGWYLDTWFTNQITKITKWTTWDITLYAKWTENKKSSWGSSGWGGGSNKTSDTQISPDPSLSRGEQDSSLTKEGDREAVEDLSNNIQDSSANASKWQTYTQEFQEAYEFAHEKWITTMNTIESANMDWKLTRIAMAKMLSQYAMNVLWQKPDETINNKFNDVTDKQNSDYDDWVTLAYQLWIMWQNMPNNRFRPNDEVTRAEFVTALSRMLYNTSDWEYKSTPKYYIHHMERLVKEWIITNDNPNMKELRGYVMIMLMRSVK